MPLDLLCINAGSSSLKYAVFRMDAAAEQKLLFGEIENIGEENGRFRLHGSDSALLADRSSQFATDQEAAQAMFNALEEHGPREFSGAGHRIVHGGPEFYDPQVADDRILRRLSELVHFAPLHLPAQLSMVRRVAEKWPALDQVVCFDTGFHRTMPELARRFALPRDLYEQGIMRYGFHGLSYEFVVSTLKEQLGRRAIVAHLGNGASMVALKDGISMDTSMGLTPAGGFMMGTRSGDLDPGILLYLLRQGWDPEKVAGIVEHESGLAGVSGVTGDMKVLLEKSGSDTRCALAVEMFCYQLRKFIGAYAATLNGLDTLVFTGGIGERAAQVRERVCRGLGFLGIELDEKSNARHAEVITTAASSCKVRVVHTDEDVIIARHTKAVVAGRKLV